VVVLELLLRCPGTVGVTLLLRRGVAQPLPGNSGGGELAGDLSCWVVEEDGHVVVVPEVAGGGDGAHVDRVEGAVSRTFHTVRNPMEPPWTTASSSW
jgi:hypothetical protein